MKRSRIPMAFFAMALLLSAFAPNCRADEWDKTTKITFSEPVQVPGKILAAGTYVFRLQDSSSNRHIVQIYNEDHTHLITTVLAIPNARLQPSDKTVLTYDERPADQPVALAAWFYPGDNSGQEFAYPKSEAEQLSRLNHKEVPSLEERTTETETAAQNANQAPPQQTPAAQPAPQPSTPPAAASNPTPPPTTTNPPTTQMAQQQQPQLPHTASLVPLIGFLGVLFIGLALMFRAILSS